MDEEKLFSLEHLFIQKLLSQQMVKKLWGFLKLLCRATALPALIF